ncbi:hypothetical protein J7K50_02630 [bacterium]|nr:hypothetical protein [bacterium]
MSENSYLFGDAKATLKATKKADGASALSVARVAYLEAHDDPASMESYAEALNNANLLEEAFKVYSEYIEIVPADQEVLFEMALILRTLKKNDDALELFTKVVEMAPNSSLARSAEYEMWAINGTGGTGWSKKAK